MKASMICETAEARDVHQIACLIGFGASCVNPYLALETIRELIEKGAVEPDFGKVMSYKKALENGLLKIMSKMGISLVSSYRGAQIFEAIGISSKLVEECFTGTSTQIEGVGYQEIAKESLTRHALAFEMQFRLRQASSMIRDTFGSGAAVSCMRSAAVIQNFHTFVGIKGADKAGKAEDYKSMSRPSWPIVRIRCAICSSLFHCRPVPCPSTKWNRSRRSAVASQPPGCPWEH